MSTENNNQSLAAGASLNRQTWGDFVLRLKNDCEGAGVSRHHTADAIFIVQAKRYTYGVDIDYGAEPVVLFEDCSYSSPKDFFEQGLEDDERQELDAKSQKEYELDFLKLDESEQRRMIQKMEGVTVTGRASRWEYVSAHFTWDAAEAFIKRKAHDYPDGLRVYAEAQTYSWEFNAIKKAIMNDRLTLVEDSGCGACYECLKDTTVNGIPTPMTRMILCPTCGNKRCPKATDHRNECTVSNEPGQPGSRYPKFNLSELPAAKLWVHPGIGANGKRLHTIDVLDWSRMPESGEVELYLKSSDKAENSSTEGNASGKILLVYELIPTTRRLTFDIRWQAPEVTYMGDDDGPYFSFTASNGYQVISRSRMDIQTERLWLLGAKHKEEARSGSMVFSSNEKRDAAEKQFIKALDEWAAAHGGVAHKLVPGAPLPQEISKEQK